MAAPHSPPMPDDHVESDVRRLRIRIPPERGDEAEPLGHSPSRAYAQGLDAPHPQPALFCTHLATLVAPLAGSASSDNAPKSASRYSFGDYLPKPRALVARFSALRFGWKQSGFQSLPEPHILPLPPPSTECPQSGEKEPLHPLPRPVAVHSLEHTSSCFQRAISLLNARPDPLKHS